MALNERAIRQPAESVLATNKVLRNTYALLSMTLLFSAAAAAVSVVMGVGHGAGLISTLVAFALVWFVLPRVANSAAGIPVVFLFTGLLGFGLGPMLSYYLAMPGGSSLIMTALGGTGLVFLGLSGYALTTRKDFSFLGGMLFVGMFVVLLGILAVLVLGFFGIAVPAAQLAISAVLVLLMSGFILFDTSRIIHGGERNYIMATVALYLDIHILFQNLLHLLGAFGSND
ncbi:MAG: Bax inhibitor-1/YccA family protein [Pseudomonadota bacterium]|nr:MAG: Bax inhibitor-1/YccA family protein [Pseudomonadota bacterium]